ncbi:MAG: hypothetical protein HFI62_04270 [Lachnospiraceae bacterium]|jgi:hypothetical protein|nr:hypothetical protein [Lachnospiraceae bacterium]
MGIGEQISNIGSEVNRAIKYKNRNEEDKKRRFYEKAVELLNLTCADPKNKFRLGELQFCIEELTDFFVGTNQYNTTDEMLMKYYDAFLV